MPQTQIDARLPFFCSTAVYPAAHLLTGHFSCNFVSCRSRSRTSEFGVDRLHHVIAHTLVGISERPVTALKHTFLALHHYTMP